MNDVTLWIGFIAAGYLSGSIPFGLLIARAKGVDIRQHGSGNIGATNVGRVLGKSAGALCFALDVIKGATPVLIAGAVMSMFDPAAVTSARMAWWFAVGVSAIIGHMYPVWLRFRGGKGVATGFGALLAMWPVTSLAALGALVVWIVSVRLTALVGVSSCLAAISLPILIAAASALIGDGEPLRQLGAHWPAIAMASVMALMVIWRHRGNIRRTLDGVEPRTTLFQSSRGE
jgi:glycerol-3-phosphate acyltransferase PlsY